jgi:hypothetical protein
VAARPSPSEYALAAREFNKTGQHGRGESFRPALFPEESVTVESLFDMQIEPDVELAEVGRFQLTRRGRHVQLDVAVAVDARKYRELLRIWGQEAVWDWGGD